MAKLAEQFGRTVRAHRKARQLTQAQLAEAADLSEEWVRRIERGVGVPSLDAVEALAGALGAAPHELFRPMRPRDHHSAKIGALLTSMSDAELAWTEQVLRAAMQYPRDEGGDRKQ